MGARVSAGGVVAGAGEMGARVSAAVVAGAGEMGARVSATVVEGAGEMGARVLSAFFVLSFEELKHGQKV
jgi:hypothetical protein